MSHTKSSHGIKNPGAGVCETTEDDSAGRKTTFMSAELNVRRRVSKEVGLTSYTFIGPAFPPPTTTTKAKTKVKSDIEDTLSEFYKELEKIDTPDAALPQPAIPLKIPTSKKKISQDVSEAKNVQSVETDGYQRSSGQRQPSRQHWYQNEPYNARRPRPGMELSSGRAAPPQNQWHPPQTLNRPPNPRFERPPFLPPPPPPAFPNPQNLPPHVNHNWSGSSLTNQYQEESHFPAFPNFPPPNVCNRPPPDFHRESPHHHDKDERVRTYDAHSDTENIGWARDRKEERCQPGEDYDRHQRYDPENEQWENHCQRPDNHDAHRSSLVLILMRGLPGSGKSTLARELLSTGPSGLILSTDDYFGYRDGYRYEVGLLGAAHEWNQSRAKDAMHDGRSPIIIDNTNLQAWEMKPYVTMALERGYKVDFCEPETSWKFDPYELEKRNKHGVPQEKIAYMMDHFSFPISIDIVMTSQEPLHVNQRRRPEQPQMRRNNQDFH